MDNPQKEDNPAPDHGGQNNSLPGFDLLDVWKEHEKVAMHFNDLLLRLRTQSLAAVAAFATVAGILLKGESSGGADFRWGTLSAVFTVLSIFWLAIWILDFMYYNRLLVGAVKAIIAIEQASERGPRLSKIALSTDIETAVMKGDDFFSHDYWAKGTGRWLFYMLVFVVLIAGTIISINTWRNSSAIESPRPASESIPHPTK